MRQGVIGVRRGPESVCRTAMAVERKPTDALQVGRIRLILVRQNLPPIRSKPQELEAAAARHLDAPKVLGGRCVAPELWVGARHGLIGVEGLH